MKKMFLFIILILMMGCEDNKKLDYNIERLENKCIETKKELEGIKSIVDDRLKESNLVLEETQVLIEQNDAFEEALEGLTLHTNELYLYSNYIGFINYQTDLFSERRYIIGELVSNQENAFEIALEIYWDKVNNKPIPLGDIWLVEDQNNVVMKRSGEVLKLFVTSETEIVIGPHGEIVNQERLLDEIDKDTILYLEIINDTILRIYEYFGPIIRLDTLH